MDRTSYYIEADDMACLKVNLNPRLMGKNIYLLTKLTLDFLYSIRNAYFLSRYDLHNWAEEFYFEICLINRKYESNVDN